MRLPSGRPFSYPFPGYFPRIFSLTFVLLCIILCPLFFQSKNSSLQHFICICQFLFYQHPVAVIDRIIPHFQDFCGFILILKLELKRRRCQHMPRRCLRLPAHIGIWGKFPIPIQISDGQLFKQHTAVFPGNDPAAGQAQRLVHQFKFRSLQKLLRLICIMFNHPQVSKWNFILHFHFLYNFRIFYGKWQVCRLQKTIGRHFLPQNIVSLRNVFNQMGL